MSRYVALLRGVNVGGRKSVSMARLKVGLEEAGFEDAQTYLQSGNVVFASSGDPKKLPGQIGAVIKDKFGHDVDVWVKSAAEMKRIASANPFLAGPGVDQTKLHVTFLEDTADPELLLKISPDLGGDDKWAPIGSEVYLYCPGGYGRTKLTNSLFENKFKVRATTRNWKTVTALTELVAKA